ncbi:unnamed protein product, partial [Allacma fusca]
SRKSVEKLKIIRELSPFPYSKRAPRADVCFTEECIDASLQLLKSINFSVNPCDDFFQYSCGKWITDNPIPPSSVRWGQFDILRQEVNNVTQGILTSPPESSDFKPVLQVKDFYSQCIDTGAMEREGLAHVIAILTIAGGWPS